MLRSCGTALARALSPAAVTSAGATGAASRTAGDAAMRTSGASRSQQQQQQARGAASSSAPPPPEAPVAESQVVTQPPPPGSEQGSTGPRPAAAGDSDWVEVVEESTGEEQTVAVRLERAHAARRVLAGGLERPWGLRRWGRRNKEQTHALPSCKHALSFKSPTTAALAKRCSSYWPRRHPCPPPAPTGRSYWWNESTGETTELDEPRPKTRFRGGTFSGAGDARFQEGWREPTDKEKTMQYSALGALIGLTAGWATQFFH